MLAMNGLIRIDDEAFEPPDPPLLPDFAPVPRKTRRVDGWTPRRQRAFIDALADTGCVHDAARRVSMTPEAAYYLRRAEGAESFRQAWEAAVEIGKRGLEDLAIDRVRNGNVVTILEDGAPVREKRWHDNRLLMFMLRHRLPGRYGCNAALSPGGRANFEDVAAARAALGKQLERKLTVLSMRQDRATYNELAGDPARRAAWELLHGKPLDTLLEDRRDDAADGD